jgi:putative heme transporter
VQIADEGSTAVETLGDQLTEGSGNLVDFTREVVTILVEASLALILVIVLSVYMLLYGERIGSAVRAAVPRGDGSAQDDFPTRIQHAVLGYVRGQLLFSTIMGASAGVMLYVLGSLGVFPEGKTYALFFGAFYGFAELIPYIGPAIGAFPPVVIALFGGEPLDAVWLVVGFILLQQIEGHIVAPNVFAQALRINPIFVIFALLMGGQLYGFIGAFIALPIAAMVRETIVYFRRHLVLEPWPTLTPGLAAAGAGVATAAPAGAQASPAEAPGSVTCPECGAGVAPGSAACPACGTELPDSGAHAAATSAAPG